MERQPAGNRAIITNHKLWPSLFERYYSIQSSQNGYRPVYPTAIECLQRELEACLTFYAFPKEHWKTIRTNNVLERIFGEVKRRSHKMTHV